MRQYREKENDPFAARTLRAAAALSTAQPVASEATPALSLRFTRERRPEPVPMCVSCGGGERDPPARRCAVHRNWHHPCELKLAALILNLSTATTLSGRKQVARAVPLSRRENGIRAWGAAGLHISPDLGLTSDETSDAPRDRGKTPNDLQPATPRTGTARTTNLLQYIHTSAFRFLMA